MADFMDKTYVVELVYSYGPILKNTMKKGFLLYDVYIHKRNILVSKTDFQSH